jgi:hypothetical protein
MVARAAQKEGPARLAVKGGVKSLWVAERERGPRPFATTRTIGTIRQGSPAAIQKMSTVSCRQRGSELPQNTVAMCVSVAYIFIFDSFPRTVLAPVRRGSSFLRASARVIGATRALGPFSLVRNGKIRRTAVKLSPQSRAN